MMGLSDQIIKHECGELNTMETIELFSELVKNGMAWTLQECYGRVAQGLIDAGVLSQDGEINHKKILELPSVKINSNIIITAGMKCMGSKV